MKMKLKELHDFNQKVHKIISENRLGVSERDFAYEAIDDFWDSPTIHKEITIIHKWKNDRCEKILKSSSTVRELLETYDILNNQSMRGDMDATNEFRTLKEVEVAVFLNSIVELMSGLSRRVN